MAYYRRRSGALRGRLHVWPRRVFNAYMGVRCACGVRDAIPCGVTCRLRVSSFRSLLDSACVYQLGTSFLKLRVPALRFYLARHPARTSPVPIPPWSTNTSSARYTACRVQRQCVRYWGVHVQAQPSPTWRTFGLRHIQSGSLRPGGRPIVPARTFFAAAHKRVPFLRSFE